MNDGYTQFSWCEKQAGQIRFVPQGADSKDFGVYRGNASGMEIEIRGIVLNFHESFTRRF
jgi:hypothetical protein